MEEISKLKCLLSNTNKQQKFSININLYIPHSKYS